jgi:hypothetical protein
MADNEVGTVAEHHAFKTASELLAEAMALLELVAERLEQEHPGL